MKLTIILILIIIVFIIYLLTNKYIKILKEQKLNPIVIKNVKNSKKEYIIDNNSIPKQGPNNQYGITVWLWLDDWNYKKGKWKHILHKGDIKAKRCQPGIWIHPKINNLSIFFDTEELNDQTMNPNIKYLEKVKQNNFEIIIDNFPIGRWFHLAFVACNSFVYVYLDGLLKKTLSLVGSGLRFNNEDLYVNKNGGFSGLLTQLKYYTIPLVHSNIADIYSKGPKPWEWPDFKKYNFKKKKKIFDPLLASNNIASEETNNNNSYSRWNWLNNSSSTSKTAIQTNSKKIIHNIKDYNSMYNPLRNSPDFSIRELSEDTSNTNNPIEPTVSTIPSVDMTPSVDITPSIDMTPSVKMIPAEEITHSLVSDPNFETKDLKEDINADTAIKPNQATTSDVDTTPEVESGANVSLDSNLETNPNLKVDIDGNKALDITTISDQGITSDVSKIPEAPMIPNQDIKTNIEHNPSEMLDDEILDDNSSPIIDKFINYRKKQKKNIYNLETIKDINNYRQINHLIRK